MCERGKYMFLFNCLPVWPQNGSLSQSEEVFVLNFLCSQSFVIYLGFLVEYIKVHFLHEFTSIYMQLCTMM